MVMNLQRNLRQPDLAADLIRAGYKGLFDFLYMPMNFRKSGSATTNFGYAFINFRSSTDATNFVRALHGGPMCYRLEGVTAEWSECQGLQANIRKFRNSPLMHKSIPLDCKPTMYGLNGERLLFPRPTKSIPRPRIRKANFSQDEPCEACV